MECRWCNIKLEEILTTFTVKNPLGKYIIIEEIPAWRCPFCGEETLGAEVSQRIQSTVLDSSKFVPVEAFLVQLDPKEISERQNQEGERQ